MPFGHLRREGTISNCKRLVLLLVGLLMAAACVSPNEISIKTVPVGATVYLKNTSTGKTTKLGRTPTVYRASDSSTTVSLVFELDGYITREVLVATPYNSQANLSVTLSAYSSEWFQSLLRTDLSQEVDDVLNELYDLPVELEKMSESEAERTIRRLRPNYENFALFHSSVGHYYYKKRDARKAKVHFSQVLKLKPEDPEAINMLRLIDNL